MTEYIDRELVKEIMQKYRCSDCTNDKSLDCPLCQLHRPFAEISKIPTADVVDVVRCKDCAVPHNRWTGCPKLNGLVTPPDFYCSYGEKEDGKMKEVTEILRLLIKAIEQSTVNIYQEQGDAGVY